jgi:hypothetical protein
MLTSATWTQKRNLSTRPENRETLIYILGRIARGETPPPEILVLLAEHPKMWLPRSPTNH